MTASILAGRATPKTAIDERSISAQSTGRAVCERTLKARLKRVKRGRPHSSSQKRWH